ncbi:MAG: excinuclease ABC subunit UvrC [Firmicutes bacterium]|nr:excinuclease ABC subunit UvrC [Bacillota bacterium]
MFDIQEELKKLPDSPGVYMHKDAFGQIIYVGKAVSLKRRVRQYFQSPKNQTPKVRRMVEDIAEFEYITCGSEMEALILECNLIKKHSPYYNILLRDDKTYPYIRITMAEDFPRILKTRRIVNDGSRYYGPYADAGAVNTIIDLLNDLYSLKRCAADSFGPGFSPCLNFHIHRCRGVCQGNISREDYRALIEKVCDFLQGRDRSIEAEMKRKMEKASEELNFEEAAVWRDYLQAVDSINQKQRVVLSKPENIDIVLMTQGLSGIHAVLFTVRDGKLSGRESFFLGSDIPGSREEICSQFIRQYYFDNVMIPKEILVASMPSDGQLLEDWLSSRRGSRVSLIVPARGEKKALMDLVRKDVNEMLKDIDDRTRRTLEKEQAVKSGLASLLGAEQAEATHRIESYDISNINGVDSVGGMVVFYDGQPMKQAYRRFRIKTVEGPDDTGSLMEVLFRRFKNAVDGTAGFTELPDLILMDGGAGQVHAAQAVLRALRLEIPVAGMVKDDKHRTRAILYNEQEFDLKSRRDLYAYVGTIQEEVHRFAIDYHHRLRGREMSRSVLDGIPGIGEKRKLSLLSYFGSVDAIREAGAEKLAEAPGMNLAVAENVVEYFAEKDRAASAGRKDGE